jgi:ribosomal protein S18 acetylase RimI-like enzyme
MNISENRTLHPCTAHHAEGLALLWERCGLTRPWNDPATDITLALAGPTSAILGVFDGEALIGSAMVGYDGHRGWVYYVAVDPDRRGEGLGRALMEASEAWLKALGAPKLQFMVRHDNAVALGFYERLGYEVQATTVLGRRLDGR